MVWLQAPPVPQFFYLLQLTSPRTSLYLSSPSLEDKAISNYFIVPLPMSPPSTLIIVVTLLT